MDQSRAPYFEALRGYASQPRTHLHVPGHIQGRGAHELLSGALGPGTLQMDLCSGIGDLDGTPDSPLEDAQALAAAAYGADRSWFLVNGSTSGNQIMAVSVASPGEVILTSRNTHKSIVSAFVVSGARPVYIAPELDPDRDIAHGVTPRRVENALEEHPEAKAVLIVSPTYYGVCSDVAGIADACHRHGVPLLVDEAWGAHFPFHPDLPTPAMALGADAAVTGTHKLVGALTQAAMLHVRGALMDLRRVEVVAKMLLSTSPSCLLWASLDVARMQMATEGELLLDQAIELAEEARILLDGHPRLSCLGKGLLGHHGVVAVDPTRLCVDVSATGHSGYAMERILAGSYDVVVEMADFAHVLANVTIGHRRQDLDRFTSALLEVARAPKGPTAGPRADSDSGMLHQPEQVLSPTEAFHAPRRRVALSEAAGCLSAELAASYPPGIPVVVPGERLTEPLVTYLAAQVGAGCRIVGPEDPEVQTISVVVE